MKKIITVILCNLCIISLAGCSKQPKSAFNFEDKIYLEERDDGWVYVSHLSYGGEDYYHYEYGSYNLKYQKIDNYYIRIYDEITGEEVGAAGTVMPYLSLLPQAEKDIRNINSYCQEKKFFSTVNESDFIDLSLKQVDKSDVMRMFNLMITQEKQPEGKYANIPAMNMMQSTVLNGYKWQAAYLCCHGNITAFRIELIYSNGAEEIHLSDLIVEEKATDYQKTIYDRYKQIEKEVLKTGTLAVSQTDTSVIDNVNFSTLYDLLIKLENGE